MKHWKNLSKRGLALFLVLMMCMSLLPTAAFAAEEEHAHNEDGWECTWVAPVTEEDCQHEHTPDCYKPGEPVVICEDDHHTEDCYGEEGNLVCVDIHAHSAGCPAEPGEDVLDCGHVCGDECVKVVTEGHWDCKAPEANEAEEIEEVQEPEEDVVPAEVLAYVEAVNAFYGDMQDFMERAEAGTLSDEEYEAEFERIQGMMDEAMALYFDIPEADRDREEVLHASQVLNGEAEPLKLLTHEKFSIVVNVGYLEGNQFIVTGSKTMVSTCRYSTGHSGYNHTMNAREIASEAGYTGTVYVTRYGYWDGSSNITTTVNYNITGGEPYKADQAIWVVGDKPNTDPGTPGGDGNGDGNNGNDTITTGGSGRYSWTEYLVYHANYPGGEDPQIKVTIYATGTFGNMTIAANQTLKTFEECGFTVPEGYQLKATLTPHYWYNAKEGGSINKLFSPTWANRNKTTHVYAQYDADETPLNTFALTYNANGGTVEGKSSHTVSIKTTDTSYPFNSLEAQREGYKFEGWYTAADGGSKVEWPKTLDTSNKTATVYAHWTKLPDTHEDATVIYLPGEGNGSKTETVPGSQDYTILSPNAAGITGPAGKVFSHWEYQNTSKDKYFPGDKFFPADGSMNIFTAVWKGNEPGSVKYTVEWYDAESGTRIKFENRTANANDPVSVTGEDKQLSGYIFQEDDSRNLESALVAADGTTVLKLYFKTAPTPDLEITKSAPSGVKVGGNVTYTITVTNNGEGDAHNVVVTDTLPGELAGYITESTPSYNLNNGVYSWNLGTIAAGASKEITFTAPGKSGVTGAVKNTAYVKSDETPDPVLSNEVETKLFKLTPTKGHEKEIAVDLSAGTATIKYTVTIKNESGFDLYGLDILDTLKKPEITQGQATLQLKPTSLTSTDGSTALKALENVFDLSIDKDTTHTFKALDRTTVFKDGSTVTLTYDVIVTNTGNEQLVLRVSNTAKGGCWTTDGTAAQMFRAMARSGGYDAESEEVGDNAGVGDNATVIIPPSNAPVTVEKTANKTTVKPGDSVGYTVTITNQTDENQTVSFEDVMGEGLAMGGSMDVTVTPSSGVISGGTSVPTSVTIPGKGTATITYTASVASTVKAGDQLTNTVTVTVDGKAVGSDSVTVTVDGEKPSTTVTYPEYDPENPQPNPDDDVTDTLAPNVTVIVDPNGGTWTPTDTETWKDPVDGKYTHVLTDGESVSLRNNPTKSNNVFMGWAKEEVKDDEGNVTTIIYTARWEADNVNQDDPTKGGPDGIPDSWQFTVTYEAVNGSVAPGSTVVTKLDEEGNPSANGTATLAGHLPTSTSPNPGYGKGEWDEEPTETTVITEDVTFTITYAQFTVTVKPTDGTDAGEWPEGVTPDENGNQVLTPDDKGVVTLPDSITPPDGKELDKWKDQDGNEYTPGKEISPNKDLILEPVWKDSDPDRVVGTAEKVTTTYDGQGHGIDPTTVKFTKGNTEVAPDAGTTVTITYKEVTGTPVNARTYTAVITATIDGKEVTVEIPNAVTINPATLRVTTGSSSKYYDGTALTNSTFSVTGQVNGEVITGRATGSQTSVGSSTNGYSLSWGSGVLPGNYKIEASLGTLTVRTSNDRDDDDDRRPSSGGGTRRPSTGGGNSGTTINDTQVPLAGDLQLNKTDHFAYIKGYQDGTVRPNNPLTRAQVATIFYRLLDEMSRTIYFQETNDFTDVANDFWACKAISTLTNAGIITGFQDGTFRPNAYITRAQFAAIAARFDNVVPGLANPFTDVSEDYWARDLIAFAADRGWITSSNDKFRPLENITRVEAMDFINNVLDRHVDKDGLLENATTWSDVPVTDPNYYVVEEATNSHDYVRRTEGQLMENWTKLNSDPVWDE